MKQTREAVGLSQQELASRANVTQQRISEWECDKKEPGLFYLARLTKILNVSFEELIEDVDFDCHK
ncbi:MAG: helix-turn-helix transcriptional regulator [Clostridia bacterium]